MSIDDLRIRSPEGSTRLFAIIGDPIVQVKAPPLLNRLFQEAALDAVMVPMHVLPAHLDSVMQGLKRLANFDGMLVTIPHKVEVCRHLDRLSLAAELSGAVNAARRDVDGRWSGDNFDGAGFVAGLRQQGHEPRGKSVVLVGTGGAGVAIAAALVECGVRCLALNDLDLDKARGLAERLNAHRPGSVEAVAVPELAHADLVINATPLGLRPADPLPFDLRELPAHAVVADIIMKPRDTELLKAAAARGLSIHHGSHMLAHQVEMYRRFFRVPGAVSSTDTGAPR